MSSKFKVYTSLRRPSAHIARAVTVGCIAVLASGVQLAGAQVDIPNLFPFPNLHGISQTLNTNGNGRLDVSGPFFQSLGTNGRSCATCHRPGEGWSVSALGVALRFAATGGTDPIFRTVDGSVCDQGIDTSTVAGRARAYRLLIQRGLIRIALTVPANAEYEVVSVNNPYGCNDTSTVSAYRRPLPATNLKFLSAVMWDGRESTPPTAPKITYATNPADLIADLGQQAIDATAGHAQGTVPLTPAQMKQIVDFETGLYTAQSIDFTAGSLSSGGANGGPAPIASQNFYVGINDPLGQNPKNTPFTPVVFNLYDAWTGAKGLGGPARASIERGQALFNSKLIDITGVAGLNDATGSPVIQGTCGTCHNSFNVGNHSLSVPLNIGVADVTNSLGVGYLPVVTLRNKSTGDIVQTTDLGRAMISGAWADIGKVKGPILRGLAARAPYFHNGSAQTLPDVVKFYNTRFAIGLTAQEQADLAAFLSAL